MKKWTVIGLWVDDEPVPVGAVEGEQDVYGGDATYEFQGPWAEYVEAGTYDEAERLAVALMNRTLASHDDGTEPTTKEN